MSEPTAPGEKGTGSAISDVGRVVDHSHLHYWPNINDHASRCKGCGMTRGYYLLHQAPVVDSAAAAEVYSAPVLVGIICRLLDGWLPHDATKWHRAEVEHSGPYGVTYRRTDSEPVTDDEHRALILIYREMHEATHAR